MTQSGKEETLEIDLTEKIEESGRALSECMTFAGVSTSTAYALYKKPSNGIAIMIGAGVAGTIADLGYGWLTSCHDQVQQWQDLRRRQEKIERIRKTRALEP